MFARAEMLPLATGLAGGSGTGGGMRGVWLGVGEPGSVSATGESQWRWCPNEDRSGGNKRR